MPVQAATRVNRSTGNGVTTVFPYTFKLISQSHIRVTVDGVVKTIATDYTVSGVGDAGGGNVTFTSAPANLAAVVLSGSAPYSRSTDYVRNGSFQEETVDNDFDLAVILMQQLDERQGRAIAIPIDDATGTDVELPVAADRASKYLAFDADGNPVATSGTSSVIVVSTFAETLLDDADAAAMRTTIGAAASGANTDITSLDAPALGAATATTQATTDSTTKVATTAHVKAIVHGAVRTTFTASGNLTFPAGVTQAIVTGQAPGGGGGGSTDGADGGSLTFGPNGGAVVLTLAGGAKGTAYSGGTPGSGGPGGGSGLNQGAYGENGQDKTDIGGGVNPSSYNNALGGHGGPGMFGNLGGGGRGSDGTGLSGAAAGGGGAGEQVFRYLVTVTAAQWDVTINAAGAAGTASGAGTASSAGKGGFLIVEYMP